jgi:hypothetical protein
MKIILSILLVMLAFACETTIYPELDKAEEILVVDAWINQKMDRQEIRITRSQPYFDHSTPLKISNAVVTVEDMNNGTVYNFKEGTDSYYWDPAGTPFGIIGHNYRLEVVLENETFEAFSKLGRVPPIDSVYFTYNASDMMIKENYFTAEFMAADSVGTGDTYWIKTWKNGILLSKPSELNTAYDAGFSAGQSVDGQAFMIPIRKDIINPMDENPETKNVFLPPYRVGDSVYVEIHSIDPSAFEFLWGVYFQINRPGGFAELFSMPLANSATNITSTRENSITNVAGFFNVAAVSYKGRRLTQEMADRLISENE